MTDVTRDLVMNRADAIGPDSIARSPKEEREFRKQRLAAGLRIFARLGFDEGVAGHITVRDAIEPDTFWVNPMGRSFKQMRVSDLIRVDDKGEVVDGTGMLNTAAFTIHSYIHKARPDVLAAAHAHSIYGKAFSSLGKLLDPLTQDACAFFEHHSLLDDYTGVVVDPDEGGRLAEVLGSNKAIVLQNHGHLTVGQTVEEACWWFVAMERSCQAQLLADAAGHPRKIPDDRARHTASQVGSSLAGWFSAQPMFDVVIAEHPGLME